MAADITFTADIDSDRDAWDVYADDSWAMRVERDGADGWVATGWRGAQGPAIPGNATTGQALQIVRAHLAAVR